MIGGVMNRRCGFTLIELLVVIAIIALLMGIMMPALRSIRKQAAGSVCLSNQHQLVLAWIMYAQENDDKAFSMLLKDLLFQLAADTETDNR